MGFWPDGANAFAAVASAVAAGVSLRVAVRANRLGKDSNATAELANQAAEAANRTADAVAQIERDRWHAELTPKIRVTITELGPGTGKASLRIALLGPPGLPGLDRVILRIRDDGYLRRPNEQVTDEMLAATVFGPYRFEPGIDNASADGRTNVSRPLLLGEWDKFSLERTHFPSWTTHEAWEGDYAGHPVRGALECHAVGHHPWYVPFEELPMVPGQPFVDTDDGACE